MSQITRTIVTAIAVLAVLVGSMAIERTGGQASATTIRPDKDRVHRVIEAPGTMVDSCVGPTGHDAKNIRPVVC